MLKITIIWHVVPQIECRQAFCQFWAIFVSLPHFWRKKSNFLKNEKKKKTRKKTHKKNKKNPARDTVDSLYLELLSISNKKLGPLDICVLSKVFFISLSRTSISQFFSLSRTKILVPCHYFSVYLEIFPVEGSIYTANSTKMLDIWKF